MPETPPSNLDTASLPALPRVPGVFVTGAGPSPGKTLVAGAIARYLRQAGRDVEVFKPASCGCRLGRGGLVSPEADFLAACAESRRTLAEIAPLRFAHALAPLAAARAAGIDPDLDAVFQAWARLAEQAEAAVVEGPGGLLCPIAPGFRTVDLAKRLAMPVVLVARPVAGTVDSVLLTHHVARAAGLHLAGIVWNRFHRDAAAEPTIDIHMQTQPPLLTELTGLPVLAVVPEDAGNSVASARLAPSARFAVEQTPWETLLRPPAVGPPREPLDRE